jgi:hypothetical protein
MAEWQGMVRNRGGPRSGTKVEKPIWNHSNGWEWLGMAANAYEWLRISLNELEWIGIVEYV